MFSMGSIREDHQELKEEDDKNDLMFGSLDDEESPLRSNSTNTNSLLTKTQIVEQFIGLANNRAKHRRSTLGLQGHWKDAAKKAGNLVDPWIDFKVDQYPEEIAICHDYDPIKNVWNKTEVTVKIESTSFGNGSMRECFRLKKLSNYSTNRDWDCASNYIAKRYIIDVHNAHYFNDVMMQMTTKIWAAHYNQYKPPKKIDIIQMSVLEFVNRPDQQFYHLEGFIEGTYMKYNSNSGFVCDETLRNTPQAFSHFTFEASNHQLIVIDIQGVGDLYTDPQIHTSRGTEYGEGNLGTRGMALFFYTHECNSICAHLNLTPFDLSSVEGERQVQQRVLSPSVASTACRSSEESLSPISKLNSFFRRSRCHSSDYGSDGYFSKSSTSPLSLSSSQLFNRSISEQNSTASYEENNILSSSFTKNMFTLPPVNYSRSQSETCSKAGDNDETQNSQDSEYNHRPSSVALEKAIVEELNEKQNSILGQIHLEICKCYQVGRFNQLGTEEFDEASAFFHLQQAAELYVKDAQLILAKIYLDLPRTLLENYSPVDKTDSITKGLQLLLHASESQDTEAILLLARFYDQGIDGSLQPDWNKAAEYYEKYIQIQETDEEFNEQHEIVARLATLYKTDDHHLQANYQKSGDLFNKAAEMATAVMKGRLANKYYQAAEEAYALEPDEES